jgi:amino acid adenylation domain-containing protein
MNASGEAARVRDGDGVADDRRHGDDAIALSFGFPRADARPGTYATVALALAPDVTDRIAATAAACQVSVDTVLAGAYGLVLERYTDHDEVGFGLSTPGAGALAVRITVAADASVAAYLVAVEAARRPADAASFDPGLVIEDTDAEIAPARRALTLIVTRGAPPRLRVVYDEARFDEASVRDFAAGYARLLADLIADPARAVGALALLAPDDHQRIVVAWNDTAVPVATDRSPLALFEARAHAAPAQLAIQHGARRLSYAELDRRAAGIARLLQDRGARPGAIIAILLPRSPEHIAAMLATWKIGAAYLPLDAATPPERLRWILADAGAALLVTAPGMPGLDVVAASQRVLLDDDALAAAAAAAAAAADPPAPPPASDPRDPVYVIYTSGSSGQPKGAVITQRSLLNLIQWHQRERHVTARDRGAQLAGLGFDAAVIEVWPYLTAGATICLPDFELPAPAQELRDWFVRERITVTFIPTPLAGLLLAEPWPADTALRLMFTAGDRLKCRPPVGLPFVLVNDYGPAENTVASTWAIVDPLEPGDPPIGRPMHNVQTYVLDHLHRPVPVGVPGELYVAGMGLAAGYLRRPELTRSRFVANPFSAEPGARMYKTGDRACYRPDGQLMFLGRRDHQIKLYGIRIELAEIEAAIEQACAAVTQAIVLLRELDGQPHLVAWLTTTAATGEAAVIAELRDQLPSRLPRQMIPGDFVIVDAFPLTPNGKIDRRALPSPRLRTAPERPVTSARTPLEARLTALWSQSLRVDAVGIDDDFFALGGDSLQMVRVLSQLRAEGFAVTTRDFLAGATPAALAQRLVPAAASAPIGGDAHAYPLSPLQHGMLFHTIHTPDRQVYLVQIGLVIEGDLDVRALAVACNAVVARHPMLRTSFHWDGLAAPEQRVAEAATIPIAALDWTAHAAADQDVRWQRLIEDDRARGFDLTRAPLVRMTVIRTGAGVHRLLCTQMHLLMAEWEVFLVFDELFASYEHARRGAPIPARPPARPFADFIHHLRAVDPAPAAAFWRHTLADYEPVSLSFGFPPPVPARRRPGKYDLRLSRHATARLKDVARVHRMTVNTVLASAFGALLGRYTDREDVVFGLITAGRTQLPPGMNDTVGLFINTLPLRLRPASASSVRAYLQATQAAVFALGEHEHTSLVDIHAWAGVEAGGELFDAILSFDEESLDVHLNRRAQSLAFRGFEVHEGSNYPLTVVVIKDDALLIQVLFDEARFDAASIRAFTHGFERLIDQMVSDADGAVGALDVLSPDDRERIVAAWNATAVDFAPHTPLLDQFAAEVRAHPDRLAVEHGARRLSYAELDALADRMAHALVARGVTPGALVGVSLARSPEWVASLLAIWKVGAAILALDAQVPPARLRFVIEDSGAALLITERANEASHALAAAHVACWDDVPAHAPPVPSPPSSGAPT